MGTYNKRKKPFNWNWVALALLVCAFSVSAGRFLYLNWKYDHATTEGGDTVKTLRVAHWQLEPGYREGLQWAIDQYNALPDVKAAGVQVVQMPISDRFFNQFMNVHLISGTAPDIAAAGKSRLVSGNAVARFYTSLGDYANQPNPHNRTELLPKALDPELREILVNSPWKDTFFDGMEGGWRPELNDYYMVPVSNQGAYRIFYNQSFVIQAKQFIAAALAQSAQPEWLQACWIVRDGAQVSGYLPDDARLREWLITDSPPETLGQLFLLCEAVQAMNQEDVLENVVPISASPTSNLAGNYAFPFFYAIGEHLDVDAEPSVSGLETYAGWSRGDWSFSSPYLFEFFDFSQKVAEYYPIGYVSLDREQTQRRFVLGQAVMYQAAGWDAASIFSGVAQRDSEADRFNVIVTPPPMPVEGERWADYIRYRRSEADTKGAVPLAINKQTPHFDWALDFLRYLSSYTINEEMNRRAGWLPVALGAEPIEFMKPFMPIVEGLPRRSLARFEPDDYASIARLWRNQTRLLVGGEIDYATFVLNVEAFLNKPRLGVEGLWASELQRMTDRSRATDRTLSVDEFQDVFDDNPAARRRSKSLVYQSLNIDGGISVLNQWKQQYPNRPFPSQ